MGEALAAGSATYPSIASSELAATPLGSISEETATNGSEKLGPWGDRDMAVFIVRPSNLHLFRVAETSAEWLNTNGF